MKKADQEKVVCIPLWVLEMLTPAGYFRAFNDRLSSGKTHPEIYEECESILEKYCLPPMYANYPSFRTGKYNWKEKDGKNSPKIRFV